MCNVYNMITGRVLSFTGVAPLPERDLTGAHNVLLFKSCISSLQFYSISCSGNFVTTLLQQRNGVTGAFVVLINIPHDERQHVDVLKTTSRSRPIYVMYIY